MSEERCTFKSPCPELARQIDDNTRGFDSVTAINMKAGTSRFIGYRYKQRAKDKGVMLNFCPWCGASLQFWERAASEETR